MILKAVLTFLVALLSTWLVLPRLSSIASRIGLMDHPNDRKVHGTPRPLVGGVGMAMGVSLSTLLFIPLTNLRGFVSGLIILVFVGFLDDFRELHHRMRLMAQVVAALLMVYFSNTLLHTFGDLMGTGAVDFGLLSIVITVFCVVGVINTLNMIDGLDGLAGGISLVAFGAFALLSALNGQMELTLVSLAFLGAVAGFLRYNWYPASLFMGDAGSVSLGFALAFLSIAITQAPETSVPPVAALLMLGVPITDTLLVMAGRARRRTSPFKADRYHLHHILMRLGYSQRWAARIIVGLMTLLSGMAVLGTVFKVPEYMLFAVCLVYFFSGLFISFNLKQVYRILKRKKLPFTGN